MLRQEEEKMHLRSRRKTGHGTGQRKKISNRPGGKQAQWTNDLASRRATHERNETISRLGSLRSKPPNLRYIYVRTCAHTYAYTYVRTHKTKSTTYAPVAILTQAGLILIQSLRAFRRAKPAAMGSATGEMGNGKFGMRECTYTLDTHKEHQQDLNTPWATKTGLQKSATGVSGRVMEGSRKGQGGI